MLIALYTIFVLGGGGTFGPMVFIDEGLDNAKSVIVEDDRRKEATATMKTMKARTKQYMKAVKGLSNEMASGVSRREATDEEIEAFWDRVFELNSVYSKDVVEIRFQLREQLTREEWAAIFPSPDSSS